jgi:hypothetical protein
MTPERDLFITGMLRSGTTLLEKLLCNQPQLSVLSQPFPYLFLETKRQFLRQRGHADERHPLGPLFREERYGPDDFAAYLSAELLPQARVTDWLQAMAGYSGQWTEIADPAALTEGLGAASFSLVLRILNRRLRHRPDARGFGSKEILCEEYLPYLLGEGFDCLLVVRDPRDVIASMRSGCGDRFVGAARPLLYELRNWRKSAAFAQSLAGHRRFHLVRYEELVTEPSRVLDALADALGLGPFDGVPSSATSRPSASRR